MKKLISSLLLVCALAGFGCSAEGNLDDHKGNVKVEGNK